ncbi:hypothetical protein ACSBR1_014714 [Camellia fascicularis]
MIETILNGEYLPSSRLHVPTAWRSSLHPSIVPIISYVYDTPLLDFDLVLQQKGCLMELVDPKLGPDFDKERAIKMIKIALLCTNPSPALRPTMSAAVSKLEGHLDIQDLVMDPSIYGDEYRFQCLRDKYDELQL